jgi:hypothetical protein
MSKQNTPSFSSIVKAHTTLPQQNIPFLLATPLRLNIKDIDLLNEFDLITSRFTPKHEGIYHIICQVEWVTPMAVGQYRMRIEDILGNVYAETWIFNVLNQRYTSIISQIVHLTPNNIIYPQLYHNVVGGALIESGLGYACYFCVYRIG